MRFTIRDAFPSNEMIVGYPQAKSSLLRLAVSYPQATASYTLWVDAGV